MKKVFSVFYVMFALIGLVYQALPDSGFPEPPPTALQSNEPADTETPLRRAYFVNLTRKEIINHYTEEFSYLPTLRLNYPPEVSQTIIRDQTRSTYLEELAHPFRESIYINGFEPTEEKDEIIIGGKNFEQKIIIRFVPSDRAVRLVISMMIFITGYFIFLNLGEALKELIRFTFKKIT